MGTITFFVATKFAEGVISRWKQYLVGSLASIFYMTNPIMANEVFRITFVWSMAWTPLLFYMAFTYLKEVSIYSVREIAKKSIYLAIVCSLIVDPFWIIASLIVLIFCFLMNLQKPLKKYLGNSFKISILIFFFYCLFSFWWIYPYLKQLLAGISLPIPYVVTWESVQMLSQNANFLNVMRLMWYWFPHSLWPQVIPQFIFPPTLSTIYDVTTVIIPLIVFSAFLLKKDRRTISVGILTIFLLTLSTGLHYDFFGKLYGWLLFNFPVWFPRTSGRWMMLVTLWYMLLLSIFSAESLRRIGRINMSAQFKKTASALFFIILFTPITIAGLPLTLNSPMTPRPIPNDYDATNQWLQETEGDFKILANPDKPFWGYLKPTTNWPWLTEINQENRTSQLNKLLEFQNIRYVLVDGNMLNEQQLDELISVLKNQENLEFCKKIGNIYVFESTSYSSILSTLVHTISVQGSLEKIISLNTLDSFNTQNSSITFLNQNLRIGKLPPANILLLESEPITHLILSTGSDPLFIEPFTATNNHNPSKLWSKAGTDDPLHGSWHLYLERRSIENWDFDYGMGLVFTWATTKLREPTVLTSDDLLNQWTFDSINDFNMWKNYTCETKFGALHLLTLDNGALRAELWNSTWGWKTITSPLIPTEYSNWYRLELRVRGENIHSAHIKIIELNEAGQNINVKTLQTIGTDNIDWTAINIDYTPEKPETRYIQLQIWHGHETTQPLPNTLWIDHLKVYDLIRFVEPVTLEIPYTIPETDQYILLARVFQNQQGGRILVQNNQESYPINTRDQLNKFTWIQLDNTTLQQGLHKITLTNLEGFNAVNLFALVPAQEYREAQTQLKEILQGKRIIHILEAETDMYQENTITTNRYGAEASNGEALELAPGSITWREVETAKPGNYTIATRSRGNLNIKLDNKTYTAETTRLDWTYHRPIPLDVGTHKIEITLSTTQQTWEFDDGLQGWTTNAPNIQTLAPADSPINGENRLMAELTASMWSWKTIISPLIPTASETTYVWSLQMAGENVHKAHIKIVEYDQDKKPLTGKHVASVGDGNFTWTPISFQYTPTPNATYIALQLWHGHETTQPLPNRIWVDDVQVTGYQPSDLDVVWIYSTNEPTETLEDVFRVDEAPAEIIEYTKIDPTKYTAKVNATEPFMLSFAESYNPLWVAWVDGEKVSSIPLYSVINGFWINNTGTLEITIEYEPQRWFYMGSAISVTTLIACAIYLTHDWAKNKDVLKGFRKWSRSNSS